MTTSYKTLSASLNGNVLSATFHAPPINLIGPEAVRDLVGLLEELSQPALPAWWSSTARIPNSSSPTST
ncbi:hypothetical protein ABR737_42655 [Streptomyces sp. Edi2]|uniref:hypothetical protein n=1 Tax=Streptomyces sp. Edi2 TaxID=3162528 RepID=UPI0033062879